MIEELNVLLDDFPGPENQTRCFLHILSITAKSIIKQFDVLKARNGVMMDSAAQALADIADGLDNEEQEEYYERDENTDDEADDEPLDVETDLQEGLTMEEREDISAKIQPVCSTLTKVSEPILHHQLSLTRNNSEYFKLHKLAYTLKKPTTVLLPQWFNTLASTSLPCRMMPRDVSMRWNSMFDMLHFALEFHPTIDLMTASCDFDLQKYELSPEEWRIATELRNILKVSFSLSFCLVANLFYWRSSRTPRSFSHMEPRTLQLWSWPWTTLTVFLELSLNPLSTLFPSTLPWSWEKKRSIDITTRPITWRFIGLWWVCTVLLFTSFQPECLWSVLHPHHKLAYFRTQDWEDHWVQTAHDLVREEFNHLYASLAHVDMMMATKTTTIPPQVPLMWGLLTILVFFLDLFFYAQSSNNIFDSLPSLAQTLSDKRDELDHYLSPDPEDVQDGVTCSYTSALV